MAYLQMKKRKCFALFVRLTLKNLHAGYWAILMNLMEACQVDLIVRRIDRLWRLVP